MNVREFDEKAEIIYATCDNEWPVVAQSSASGMVWSVGSMYGTTVTEEMVVMGCPHPVGTPIMLITLD